MWELLLVSIEPLVSDPEACDHFLHSEISAIVRLWGWGTLSVKHSPPQECFQALQLPQQLWAGTWGCLGYNMF